MCSAAMLWLRGSVGWYMLRTYKRALSLVGVLCLSFELAFNFTSSEIANCCDGSLKCCDAENFKTALYNRTIALHLIGSNQML